MSADPVSPSDHQRPDKAPNRLPLLLALVSSSLVLLTLCAALMGATSATKWSLFLLAGAAVFAILYDLYRVTLESSRSAQLNNIRLHIIMHFVPLAYFGLYLREISSPWLNFILVTLLVIFFLSGKVAWRELGDQYPSTLLYRMFYRGNTAFMTSFPLLYLLTLLIPDIVNSSLIDTVAVFYFSIHFILLGVSCLKIKFDLRSTN